LFQTHIFEIQIFVFSSNISDGDDTCCTKVVVLRTFPRWFHSGIALLTLTCRSLLTIFWMYHARNINSLKLMEFVSLNPKPLLVISFVPLYMFYWRFNMVVNYSQQAPSSLTFASPLAELNSANYRLGVAAMLSLLKSTHASITNSPPD
jgi:hypothetical protein